MGNQEDARMVRNNYEVDKLSKMVVTLEGTVQGGIKAEDKEFVVLIEMLMKQLLKLDEIEAEGELKMQRKREVHTVLSFVESLDKLRTRNCHMNCSGSSFIEDNTIFYDKIL